MDQVLWKFMNVRHYNVIIHLLHVLFIFTWLCAVNVPKFIVDNKKKKGLFLNTKIEI